MREGETYNGARNKGVGLGLAVPHLFAEQTREQHDAVGAQSSPRTHATHTQTNTHERETRREQDNEPMSMGVSAGMGVRYRHITSRHHHATITTTHGPSLVTSTTSE